MPLLDSPLNPTAHVTKALKIILRPLLNLLISHGITYPIFSEILKQMYVEIADTKFKLAGKVQSDSRLNFLTGIHRKDIKRLKNINVDDGIFSASPSLGAQLIAHWIGDPNFLDEQGTPIALPRSIKQGGEISFEGLVIAINNDIRSRVILDEWLHQNIVYLDKNDKVCLNQKAFIPENDFQQKAWFFGENISDHIAVSVHNLNSTQPPLFERAVYYDQLSSESVHELTELSEQLGMETLIKINSHALALQNQDKQKKDTSQRFRLGLYFYKSADKKTRPNKEKKD